MVRYIIINLIGILFYYLGGIIWLRLLLYKRKTLIVLMYHNFSLYHNFKINRGSLLETGYSRNFETQIKFLKKYFHFSYPEEFYDDVTYDGTNILLTFDDGYKDNYDIAYPILTKYNAKAIFFIPTNFIGTKKWLWHDKVHYLVNQNRISLEQATITLKEMNRGKEVPRQFVDKVEENFFYDHKNRLLMDWEEIIELYNSGFSIGSHSCNHQILTFVKPSQQEYEINNSVQKIQSKLGNKCLSFGYPNGLYNSTSLNLLKQYDVQYAFTTNSGINKASQDRLEIKRIGVNASDSIYCIILKLFINSFR